MSKKLNEQVGKILFGIAIISFLFTFIYGLVYYRTIENDLFYLLTVLQNSIKAFTFKSNISFDSLAQDIAIHNTLAYKILGYCYGIACFTAPYCTISFCYKIIQKFARLRLSVLKHKNYRHIIIFGYNEEVKALLSADEFILGSENTTNAKPEKCKIHLVSSKGVPDKDAAELIHKNVVIHDVDILSIQNDKKQVDYFLKQIESEIAQDVILFEESSSKNFSLYHFFQSVKSQEIGWNENTELRTALKEDVKFFCRCEDDGIQKIIEDYHDSKLKKGNYISDLEIVSIPELRIRKMLKKNPLHSYYLKSNEPDPNKWDLHLLIIGFGKLGQQLLLQAMNLGVTGSRNQIIIDVIDNDVEKQKSIFANHFNEKYVKIDEQEISIGNDKADGNLLIRFRQMDIRYKQFSKQLEELGEKQKFTYVAICVEDTDLSLHCLVEVKNYLNKCSRKADIEPEKVKFAIRMDLDKCMEEYINTNDDTYDNVIAIESMCSSITLEELIEDEVDWDAKLFNHTYNSFTICNEKDLKETSANQDIYESEEQLRKTISSEWKSLTLFRRNASRAIAQRTTLNADIMKAVLNDQFEEWFGKEGKLLRYMNGSWVYDVSDEEFARIQSDQTVFKEPSEFSRLEHRRWCYYTASCGWSCTPSPDMKKNDKLMENPCLCTWDELALNLPSYCVYDLMPMLYEWERRRKEVKNETNK